MSKKYDVCAIGNALVDYEIEVNDAFLKENNVEKGLMTLVDESRQSELLSKSKEGIKNKQGGGSAANSIVGFGQFGGKPYYTCKVANDEDGQFYLKDLADIGVATNLDLNTLSEGTTGKCLVLVTDDAERTMNTFLGITTDFSPNELDEEAIKNSEYLFMEGFFVSSPTAFEAMKHAKKVAEENEVKVALSFSDPAMVKYFGDNMKEVVGDGVDLLFCNVEEAETFTNTSNIYDAVESLKNVAQQFVITKGDKGAVAFDGVDLIEIDSVPVKAIDTTGAGDMFAGAYLFGVISGFDTKKAGKLASMASSAVVGQYGPRLPQAVINNLLKSI